MAPPAPADLTACATNAEGLAALLEIAGVLDLRVERDGRLAIHGPDTVGARELAHALTASSQATVARLLAEGDRGRAAGPLALRDAARRRACGTPLCVTGRSQRPRGI